MSSPLARADQVAIGDCLFSKSSTYLVQSFLGQGTFGKVAKCTRMRDNKTIAIKMMKNQGSLVRQATAEVHNLLRLKHLDSDKSNIVRFYEFFAYGGHNCLEFEALDKSLFDFMMERNFQPLHLKEIRPIVQQITVALEYLRTARIIHADLKLANVMLVNHVQEPYRIKVIDFGLACHVSSARLGSYIQTRYYRSPEIILGLPFTEAVDMWSLGCIAAEMYIGNILFPGSSEYDMMRYIVETQGQPPDHLLTLGLKTDRFFQKQSGQEYPTNRLFQLKTPEQYHQKTGYLPLETRRRRFKSLYDLIKVQVDNPESPADKVAVRCDQLMFMDMLHRMLELDAAKRITPRQVLEHQFVGMDHLVRFYRDSSHVKSCFLLMDFCRDNTPSWDSGRAESRPLQQDPPSTSHPVQQITSPSAETNELSQACLISPRPCVNTQTSGMKRKADDDDGTKDRLSKKSRPESYRGNCTRPATSSSSQHASTDTQARSAVWTLKEPAQLWKSKINRHSSQSSRAQSAVQSGVKRKADDNDGMHHHALSDRYKRSDDDRKRFRKDLTRPSSQSRTQRCHSPRVKRKRSRGDDHDSERSGHERKRARESSAAASTLSSSSSAQTLHGRPHQRSIRHEHHYHRAHSSFSTWAGSGARSRLDDDRRTGEGDRRRGRQGEYEDRRRRTERDWWRRRRERERRERRRSRRRSSGKTRDQQPASSTTVTTEPESEPKCTTQRRIKAQINNL